MALNYACTAFTTVDDLIASDKCHCDWDEVDDADFLEGVIDMASDMLTLISGRRIHGVCTATVRPVGDWGCIPAWGYESYDGSTAAPMEPWLIGTVFLRGPNTVVTEVRIDGVVVPPSEYSLIEGKYLQREEGGWPTANDPKLPTTEVGTWSITYSFGRTPDFVTEMAAIELACELGKSFLGKPNALPPGVSSANLQGATVSISQAAQDGEIDEQLPAVARFVALYSFEGNFNRSGVWSPELEGDYTLIQVTP